MNNLFAQSRSHWVRYDRYEIKGSTAQFGKSIRPKILPHTKVIKGREYCMYFPLL